MALSDQQLMHFLVRMPFVDSVELAGILGEPHATVHRALTDLLAGRIVGRVSHGTAHLPSSRRYYLTALSNAKPPPEIQMEAFSCLTCSTERRW